MWGFKRSAIETISGWLPSRLSLTFTSLQEFDVAVRMWRRSSRRWTVMPSAPPSFGLVGRPDRVRLARVGPCPGTARRTVAT